MSAVFRAKVRMYRQGIGDCFLVRLPRPGKTPMAIVIDCGVVLGTPDARDMMAAVADDLQKTTGGDPATGKPGRIDLLVITHEHWDHVSGFSQVKDWTDRFEVQQVWAAWTEDPDNAQAQKLDKAKKHAMAALRGAAMRAGAAGDGADGELMSSLFGFFGITMEDAVRGFDPFSEEEAQLGFSARATTRSSRNIALACGKADPVYLKPGGDPIALDEDGDVNVYVLGPPTNEKLLKKANPSKADPETYSSEHEFTKALASVLGAAPMPLGADDRAGNPFAGAFEIPVARAKSEGFFRERYFEATDDVPSTRSSPKKPDIHDKASWRRIDNDWFGSFTELAMKLDSATNNTSLALAIEIGGSGGDILLFPADAQVGNWLSWHDVEWEGEGADTTAKNLLERTVFYKVGHHGSHNATLKEQGLELMKHGGLTAMIPVNHKIAVKKGWDEMPLNSLVARLREKTKGRVLQADQPPPKRPAGTSKKDWKAFKDRLTVGDNNLWYELTF